MSRILRNLPSLKLLGTPKHERDGFRNIIVVCSGDDTERSTALPLFYEKTVGRDVKVTNIAAVLRDANPVVFRYRVGECKVYGRRPAFFGNDIGRRIIESDGVAVRGNNEGVLKFRAEISKTTLYRGA